MSSTNNRSVTTREGYAHWAAGYDAQDNPMTAMVAHVLAAEGGLARGRRVFELGCGTGRNAAALCDGGAVGYLGIDGSPEMLAVARSRTGDPRVRFEHRDLTERGWHELGLHDLVLVSLVFEHFECVDDILAGAARVAAPGALLWILELHPRLHAGGVGAHVEVDGETLVLPSFRHAADELVAALDARGWEPVSTTDRFATTEAAAHSRKLARYLGSPVLLDVRGRRRP